MMDGLRENREDGFVVPDRPLSDVDRLLKVPAAAEFLGISKSTLYKLMSARQIPFSKPNGKMAYFRAADLRAWALRNRFSTQEEIEYQARRKP